MILKLSEPECLVIVDKILSCVNDLEYWFFIKNSARVMIVCGNIFCDIRKIA